MKVTGFIISSGHTNVAGKDRGASSPDGLYVEGNLTVEAKNLLVHFMKQAADRENIDITPYLLVDRDDTALADTLKFLKGRTKPDDILIDIHWNAANGKARGTEVIVPENPTATEIEIADRISDIFGNTLGTPERGVLGKADGVKTENESKRGKLGWMRLVGHNILIEVEFIDNPIAMIAYEAKKSMCWKLVADYLVGLLKQSIK